MVASSTARAADAIVFDLDEDVTAPADEPVVDEPVVDEPVVDPVASFDLDEDGLAIDRSTITSRAGPAFDVGGRDEVGPDVLGLDEDICVELRYGADPAEADIEALARDAAEAEAIADSAAEMEADALAAAMMIQLDEGDDDTVSGEPEPPDDADGGDSLWEPPDDISTDDVREAQRDEQHTRLMGQYMTSRGVIP